MMNCIKILKLDYWSYTVATDCNFLKTMGDHLVRPRNKSPTSIWKTGRFNDIHKTQLFTFSANAHFRPLRFIKFESKQSICHWTVP